MHVRCPYCRASTWLNLNRAAGTSNPACKACTRRFDPTIDDIRNRSSRLGRGDAIAFADLHGVDLFSAHSVLLGLMPVGRAKEIRSERPAQPLGASPVSADPRGREEARLKRQAKGSGSMAPLDTVEIRNYLITILIGAVVLVSIGWSTVHLMNRETRQARRLQEAGLADGRVAPSPDPEAWFDDDPATAAWNPGEATPAVLPVAEIERSPEGQVVRITAGHPVQVLEAYCSLRPEGFRRSMGMADTGPAAETSRFGLYQDNEFEGPPRAIQIRKDRKSRRWSAGDGRSPIPTFPAEAVLMAASEMQLDGDGQGALGDLAVLPVKRESHAGPRLGWGVGVPGVSSDGRPGEKSEPDATVAPDLAR